MHRSALTAVSAVAFVISLGTRVSPASPARNDCMVDYSIVLQGQECRWRGGARCIDGDPTCDMDGRVNGQCEMSVNVALNAPTSQDLPVTRGMRCRPADGRPDFSRCRTPTDVATYGPGTSRHDQKFPPPASIQSAVQAALPATAETHLTGLTLVVGPNPRTGRLPNKVRIISVAHNAAGDRRDRDVRLVACKRSKCGNGRIDRGEQCDDGNNIDGDGCQNNCVLTPPFGCGDNVVNRPSEECDGTDDAACGPSGSCIPPGQPFECHCAIPGRPMWELLPLSAGFDLDIGWRGSSHNQPGTAAIGVSPLILGTLANCDNTTDFDCDLTAGGAGVPYGPPLPIGVPLATCVTNVLKEPVTGAVSLQTGDASVRIHFDSEVRIGVSPLTPCPICGKGCSGGSNAGEPCDTDADCPGGTCVGDVDANGKPICKFGSREGQACVPEGKSAFGRTSTDCPASSSLLGVIDILFDPATTGTASLPAGVDCVDFPAGPDSLCWCPGQKQPNVCPGKNCEGGGNAGETCTTDSDCPDPFAGACVNKCRLRPGCPPGSQACCPDLTLPCFPEGQPVVRVGVPDPLNPTLASAFCIGASGSVLVDQPVGLPGPGALLLPGRIKVLFP